MIVFEGSTQTKTGFTKGFELRVTRTPFTKKGRDQTTSGMVRSTRMWTGEFTDGLETP